MHGDSLKENVDSNRTEADLSTLSLGDGGDTTDISMTESFSFDTCSVNEEIQSITSSSSSKEVSPDHRSLTLPANLTNKNMQKDELDELLQVERQIDNNQKLYQTLPTPLSSESCTDRESSFDSNIACISSSQPDNLINSDTDELSKSETDYKSVGSSITSTDDSTLTNKLSNDAYLTPLNTFKPVDFDDFKEQMQKEFVQNTSQLQNVNNDTLKSRQPIDPSRINDSLKLYSENMMNNSFNGNSIFKDANDVQSHSRMGNTNNQYQYQYQYQLSPTDSSNYVDKSITSTSDITSYSTASSENCMDSSKFSPHRYKNHQLLINETDSDDGSATLRPATIKKRTINMKMDCYDELGNGVSSTTSGISTPLNTPTTPNDDNNDSDPNDCIVVLRKPKTGSTAIKRRSGNRRYSYQL